MSSSTFGFQESHFFTARELHHQPGKSAGFTYIALLVIIVIIGISLGAAGKYWQNVMTRDKEEELLFRGDQYRLAIEHYFLAIPGAPQYPQTIDDLLTDGRTEVGMHYLRRKYKDPMTGKDFKEIRDPLSNRITGVYSESNMTPLKQANFPGLYKDFEGKQQYSDWRFISSIITAPTASVGYNPRRMRAMPTPQPTH